MSAAVSAMCPTWPTAHLQPSVPASDFADSISYLGFLQSGSVSLFATVQTKLRYSGYVC